MSLVKKRSVELIVIRDIFNPSNNIEQYRGRDVEQLLKQAFGGKGLSQNVHLYHNDITNDVTPKTPQDVDKIMRLSGRIYAVVRPMGFTPFEWVVIGISLLTSVAMAFMMPKMPDMNGSNQPPSPNNALASRTNRERLGGRIPDIFGTVWSVPDLIAPVYSVYIDHEEVEYSYMCIGRGRFNVMKAYDDTSDITKMAGTTVQIYEPNTNISITNPVKEFGAPMSEREKVLSKLAVKRYTAVNGQVLKSPENTISTSNLVFQSPNLVAALDGDIDLTKSFKSGDTITITTSKIPKSHRIREGESAAREFDLAGTYTLVNAEGNSLALVNPASVNPAWNEFNNDGIDWTLGVNGSIKGDDDFEQWQGAFYIDDPDSDGIMINFVAPNGLYTVHPDGDKFAPLYVEVEIKTEALDENNEPIAGTIKYERKYIKGRLAQQLGAGQEYYQLTTDDEVRRSAALTIFLYRSGRHRVWVRRFSKNRIPNPPQQYFEEVKIKDLYSYTLIASNKAAAANTTRVYVKTVATEGALSVKERKLRLLVQRYVTDATSGVLKLSNRADDIIRHIATDAKIGNLDISQVDVAQIKTEVDNIVSYFGTEKCAEFCGTFDDNNLSSEETLQIVAKAVFSQAKRQGNKVMLDFERLVPASVAVFNSHNVLPDTFTAPQSFGVPKDRDGVKIEYTDPIDDAVVTLSYPSEVLSNPHEDKLIGVRNKIQAHIHAMRLLNRDLYVYKSCEFTAGDESNIVVRTNRITVADQLRADVQQGSIDSITTVGSDLILNTSDPVLLSPSGQYTAFIQTINNGVEAIAVTANDDYSVKLARLPSGEISGADNVVQAVYQIVSNDDKDRDAYLVAEKSPSEGMTNKLTCTNYDDRFYQNDTDYKNGLIALN